MQFDGGGMWGDGDLGYSIEVHGNTFNRTGGDAGSITGAFFGSRHEGMGGVLERSDLSAGFGENDRFSTPVPFLIHLA